MDLNALKTELLTDPAGLYGDNVEKGDCRMLAEILNTLSAGIPMPVGIIPTGRFLSAFTLEIFDVLLTTDEALQRKWLGILDYLVKPMPEINLSAPATLYMLALLQQDGFLRDRETEAGLDSVDAQLARLLYRDGSRAEQLFGTDSTVSSDDVARALNL